MRPIFFTYIVFVRKEENFLLNNRNEKTMTKSCPKERKLRLK